MNIPLDQLDTVTPRALWQQWKESQYTEMNAGDDLMMSEQFYAGMFASLSFYECVLKNAANEEKAYQILDRMKKLIVVAGKGFRPEIVEDE